MELNRKISVYEVRHSAELFDGFERSLYKRHHTLNIVASSATNAVDGAAWMSRRKAMADMSVFPWGNVSENDVIIELISVAPVVTVDGEAA